jgi:hypothetical protein
MRVVVEGRLANARGGATWQGELRWSLVRAGMGDPERRREVASVSVPVLDEAEAWARVAVYERYRAAATLHEQAVRSAAAFAVVMSTTRDAQGRCLPGENQVAGALAELRADLVRQAERYRQLMVTLRPMCGAVGGGREALEVALRGCFGGSPEGRVELEDGLSLSWPIEAILVAVAYDVTRGVRLSIDHVVRSLRVSSGDRDDVVLQLLVDGPLLEGVEPFLASARAAVALSHGSIAVERELRASSIVVRLEDFVPIVPVAPPALATAPPRLRLAVDGGCRRSAAIPE